MNGNDGQFIIENDTLVAYTGCGGDIVIPSGVKKLGAEVFKENHSLLSVDLNEVTEVGCRAFYDCRNLKTVTGKNVRSVGDDSFRFCGIERITFGAVERVGKDAFFGCMYCSEIIGTDNLVDIDENAFEGTKITSMTISPNAVRIGAGAFSCCSRLKRFTVPCGIKTLEGCVFAGCHALKSVELSEGLERIENAVFFNCDMLKCIEIPSTVTFIHARAFERCRIAYVCNNSSFEIKKGKDKPGGLVATFAVHVYSPRSGHPTLETIDDFVFCTDETTDTPYLLEYLGSETELVLPRDYHGKNYRICRLAFGNANITSVDIGDGVSAVESLAFFNCKDLKEVKFGKCIKLIDRLAFRSCKLKHVTLGENVELIGVGAFLATDLEYIVMGRSVREIRNSAFDSGKEFKAIYYMGTSDEFDQIKITGGVSRRLKSMARYYSEYEPTDTYNKYWHYVNGNVIDWD